MRGRVDAARQAGDGGEARPRSSPRAIRCVSFMPAAEALREPTMATAGMASVARWPRTAISGGASSIICRRCG